MTNNDREDKSGAFEQGEILSAIEPQPPTENKVVPFKPLDMASLAGLKVANPAESALAITEQEENIAESKTKLPVYKQSLYKMATVGGALLVAALALGAIVFGGQKQETVSATPTPAPSPPDKSKEDFKPDPRFGVVNSKLAMEGQQRQIIDAAVAQQKASADKTAADRVAAVPPANGNPAPSASLNTKNPTPPTGDPQVVTNTTQQPDPVYQAPPQVTIPQSPPPATTSVVKPVPARIEPPVQKVALVTPQPIKVAATRPVNSTPIIRSTPVTWEVANKNAVGVWGRTGGNETSGTANATTAPITPTRIAQANPSDGAIAFVGQQIKAKLITPYQAVTTSPSQPIFLALGAFQAVGKNLTQPQTQTIATGGGFLQTTNTQQSIVGSVLDGGFSPLVSQWMERNKQATTQINSASKIWYLPTGTEVNLIVAQPFSI